MAIEQRVRDALTDLQVMLVEGSPPDEALEICAADNGLKVEALAVRAAKEMGDLANFRTKALREAEVFVRDHKVETAFKRYVTSKPELDYPTWFEKEAGRPMTLEERKAFRIQLAKVIATKLFSEFEYD